MIRTTLIHLTVILFLFGCSENSTEPNVDVIFGNYSSSLFTLALDGNSPIDVLSAGGYINIELSEDSTTIGELFIPDTLDLTGGGDLKFNLIGQFKLEGNSITFEQNADTFIRNAEWLYSSQKISGNYSKDGVVIEVVLQK